MSDFEIKFRGTRGSYPTAKINYMKYGGNTACVEVRCGNQLIILDAGTGIIDLGLDEIKNKIISKNKSVFQTTIFLSHIHQDHIQGLQFYKPLFKTNSTINLFGPTQNQENLKDTLNKVLFDKVFPLAIDEIKSDFNVYNFSPNDAIIISQDGTTKKNNTINGFTLKDDDILITSYKTLSHPKNGCLCIKIQYKDKILVYATDKESSSGIDRDFILFAKNADCLIHDSQYTYQDYYNPVQSKQGFGHSTFEMALDIAKETKAKKIVFFHYDPEYDDDKLTKLEKGYSNNEDIFFAKENFEIEL